MSGHTHPAPSAAGADDGSRGLVLSEDAAGIWQRWIDTDGPLDVEALVASSRFDQSQVMLAAGEAEALGFAVVSSRPRDEIDVTDGAALRVSSGLSEVRAAALLAERGGRMALPAFVALAAEHGIAVNEVFKHGPARGWIARGKGESGPEVSLTDAGASEHTAEPADVAAIRLAGAGTVKYIDELEAHGVDAAAAGKLLGARPELARLRRRTQRLVQLTEAGRTAFATVTVQKVRNALTQTDLRDGTWREIALRPYDVTLPAATVRVAKPHPVRRIIEQTRRAFLELGFVEVASPAVESAFWNFDALFQPQDHPARDMQDTFYMSQPHTAPLPEAGIMNAVKAAHEDGGDTGSTGWGYKWRPERAQQIVLRTHTTAATIRALAANPNPPFKAFCVGWTHRNETLSYKHLPVFHQVDGIVIDEHASLATLLGTLTAFYQKMGFEKVRFKPAFYPYTEPSVDVMVYMPERGKWLEMGGCGIFRPEVTEPLGCKHPVLAWGLGVERLAMLRLGFSDIRDLYKGGLETIEGVPLCR